jgi:PAS domain S-box-containing protein
LITDVNKAVEKVTGYSREELIGTDFTNYFADPEQARENYQKVFREGSVLNRELEIKHRDGPTIPVLYNSSVRMDENDKVLGVFAAARDITERKKAEEALRNVNDSLEERVKERTSELEETCELLLENERTLDEAQKLAHIGNWDWNIVTDKIYWSDEVYHIFGLDPQEFGPNNKKFLNYVHPDDREYVGTAVKEALNGKFYSIDYRIILANGEERIVHEQREVIFNEEYTAVRMKGTVQDITEQENEKKALQESEEKYRNIVETANEGIWLFDAEFRTAYANEKLAEMLGYSRKEMIGRYVGDFTGEENKVFFIKTLEERRQGINGMYELRLVRKDGSTLWTIVNAKSLFNKNGEFKGSLGMLTDITERKKVEEKTQNLANIIEYSNDAIITKSLDGIITSWNKGAEQIYGYSAKEILGKPISILEPSILVEETEELAELIKQGDRIHSYETLRLKKDGRIINVSLTLSQVYDTSGELTAISVIARDITKSKIAEEKLRKSAERYSTVTEQTGQVVYEYDSRTDKGSWAGAIEEVTGYNSEELQRFGKDFWIKNIYRAEVNLVDEKVQNVRMSGGRFKEELRLRKKDGTCIYIENSGVCLTDHEGQPYGAIGVLKDITSAKIAEIQLQESERRYRSFIQNFHGIAFQADENFVPVFLHGAVEEITGYNEEEFISRIKWKDIIHPDDLSFVIKEEEKIRSSQSAGYEEIEFRIKHRDGRIRWINEVYQKIQRENGKPEFYQGTIYDVTERKETEKFLQNIETARKKEIHHRIKNNLQVISSLLDLQAEKFSNRESIKDSEVLEAFRESQDRVISMALIHEELYKGGGLDTLNFSSYLEELVESLFLTYKLGNVDTKLDMDLEENIFFNMDTAVPLSIIINELVSNSLKHAFANKDAGMIQIKLCRQKSQENKGNKAGNNSEYLKSTNFILKISDNGIGIPESFDLENPESLGMQLVTTLVDQLEGELELKRETGTEFTLQFIAA